jgi:hypothetical protein
MNYAILRTAKLKKFSNISGSARHNFREKETPNADSELTIKNYTSGCQSSKELLIEVKKILETVPTVRKNAVLAIEYFIGASPEFFTSETQTLAYFDKAEQWLKQKHGAENVLTVTRQFDETSPHICAYVVPIDEKGRLNCSFFLDGREKLSELQTDFAEECGKQFGLERGIEGSKARHTTIKEYYSRIQAPVPESKTIIPQVAPPTGIQIVAEALGFETEHARQKKIKHGLEQKKEQEKIEKQKSIEAKAKQYDLEAPKTRLREAKLIEIREASIQLREIPLESVLQRLDCQLDKNDRKNWKTPAGRMTITGNQFYAHDLGKGGGGAIDLVMMLEQVDYKNSVNWLSQQFGTGAVLSETISNLKPKIEEIAKSVQKSFSPPQPVQQNWHQVKDYLTQTRGLSEKIINEMYTQKKLYADQYKNAVFVLGDNEGVVLRGTTEKPFHGVRGKKLAFEIESQTQEKKVAFVESVIDAMSLRDLNFTGKIIATSGNSNFEVSKLAKEHEQQGFKIIAAFDNDRAGEAMCRNLGYSAERMKPKAKDWNDDLLMQKMNYHQKQDFLKTIEKKTLENSHSLGFEI